MTQKNLSERPFPLATEIGSEVGLGTELSSQSGSQGSPLAVEETKKHLDMSSPKRSAAIRDRMKLTPWEMEKRQKLIVVLMSDTELLDQASLNSKSL